MKEPTKSHDTNSQSRHILNNQFEKFRVFAFEKVYRSHEIRGKRTVLMCQLTSTGICFLLVNNGNMRALCEPNQHLPAQS